jgi:uncharacterized protein YbjT (DUF2867 family)
MPITVLVTGATGRFGRICGLLLERGHRVRGVTRQPSTLAARELSRAGADVVAGDLDDPASLKTAMDGVDAVFATGTAHKAGIDGERRHGQSVADAARAAGIPHLVHVSGAGAALGTGVPIFETKAKVENYIAALGVPCTVIAPVYLMENLFNPWNMPALQAGRLPTQLRADRSLQQVPVADVINFAVFALEHPARFIGQRIEIASDELTATDMAETISRSIDQKFPVELATSQELAPGLASLFDWLQHTGHHVDIQGLRSQYPEVGWHDFDQWISAIRQGGPR